MLKLVGDRVTGADGDRRAAYDAWAAVYPPTAHNAVMRAEQQVIEPLLRTLTPRRALDLGTGSGRYLDLLGSVGAFAIGVDFSFGMLTAGFAARSARCRRLCVCADARKLPLRSASVDLVNASLMVGDLEDLAGWAREVNRVLAPGGNLVYSDFHPNWRRLGWRRTFVGTDGATRELPLETHELAHHEAALAEAGLTVRTICEAGLADERDESVRAFRARWGNAAVIVAVHAAKP